MKKRSILLNGMALVTAVVAVLFIAAEPHEYLPGSEHEIVIRARSGRSRASSESSTRRRSSAASRSITTSARPAIR